MKKLLFIYLALVPLVNYAQKLPNVIVVLADDIGLGDISYYRRMHSDKIVLETPNLDRLASQGMAFTNAHAPAALCAPSRYAIMTGNSCFRSPFPWGVWGAYQESPIKADQLTLGTLMKQAGYHTAFLGKWHLGGDYYAKDQPGTIYRGPRNEPELDVDITRIVGGGPSQNGFDYNLTLPAGIQASPYAVYENDRWMPLQKGSKIGFISQENMTKIGVKLDKLEGLGDLNWDPHKIGPLLAKKGVDFIERHANKENPFFMYYCSQAVHLPHSPPEMLDGVKIAGTTPSPHMDMIKELDVQMGMLLKALKAQGIYENTLFIFTSDNGGLLRQETLKSGHQPSDIYRGGKNMPFEGGHRVPFIASWPEKIKPGQTNNAPILGLDIMATLAQITKQDIPKNQAADSYNLLPYLFNTPNTDGHPFLITQGGTGKEAIIIEDGWKLIIQIDKKDKTNKTRSPHSFFNLATNPSEDESDNLVTSLPHQEQIQRLFDKYNQVRGL